MKSISLLTVRQPGRRIFFRSLATALALAGFFPAFLHAQYAVTDVAVTEGTPVQRTVSLPAGADVLRVTGDWTTGSGGAQSQDLSVTVLGPDGQTGNLVVFDNALATTDAVNDLEGELVLSSQGTAGTYTLTFTQNRAASSANLVNIQIDAELILDGLLTDARSLTVSSPTFNRPVDETFGAQQGGTYNYGTFTFTAQFSGEYSISSIQNNDGMLFLYTTFAAGAPLANGVGGNDDSPRGVGYSKFRPTLTAGQSYTLVTTTFDAIQTMTYTNTVRYSVRLDQLPASWVAFQALHNLMSLTGDKDHDGLEELFEYALATDPEQADDPGEHIELVYEGSKLGILFTQDASLADISYIVEARDGLTGPWTILYDSSIHFPGSNSNGSRHKVLDTLTQPSWSGGKRFLRLRIEYTGP